MVRLDKGVWHHVSVRPIRRSRIRSKTSMQRESDMSTGAEFSGHRPRGDDARRDERFVRILLVEDRTVVADELRQSLGQASHASFDVVQETNLIEAAAQIQGDTFDILVVDSQLSEVDRHAALELASDLAHRLPVVVLTGTQSIAEGGDDLRGRLRACIAHANVPAKLLSAIRRSRRLGTGVMAPTFCRLEELRR